MSGGDSRHTGMSPAATPATHTVSARNTGPAQENATPGTPDTPVPTQPRSGMTRNGRAYAPATSARRTAATGSSSSPGSPPPCPASSSPLLPTPAAGNFNDTESLQSWEARRDRQKQLGR